MTSADPSAPFATAAFRSSALGGRTAFPCVSRHTTRTSSGVRRAPSRLRIRRDHLARFRIELVGRALDDDDARLTRGAQLQLVVSGAHEAVPNVVRPVPEIFHRRRRRRRVRESTASRAESRLGYFIDERFVDGRLEGIQVAQNVRATLGEESAARVGADEGERRVVARDARFRLAPETREDSRCTTRAPLARGSRPRRRARRRARRRRGRSAAITGRRRPRRERPASPRRADVEPPDAISMAAARRGAGSAPAPRRRGPWTTPPARRRRGPSWRASLSDAPRRRSPRRSRRGSERAERVRVRASLPRRRRRPSQSVSTSTSQGVAERVGVGAARVSAARRAASIASPASFRVHGGRRGAEASASILTIIAARCLDGHLLQHRRHRRGVLDTPVASAGRVAGGRPATRRRRARGRARRARRRRRLGVFGVHRRRVGRRAAAPAPAAAAAAVALEPERPPPISASSTTRRRRREGGAGGVAALHHRGGHRLRGALGSEVGREVRRLRARRAARGWCPASFRGRRAKRCAVARPEPGTPLSEPRMATSTIAATCAAHRSGKRLHSVVIARHRRAPPVLTDSQSVSRMGGGLFRTDSDERLQQFDRREAASARRRRVAESCGPRRRLTNAG